MRDISKNNQKQKISIKRIKNNENTSNNYFTLSLDFKNRKYRCIFEFIYCIKTFVLSLKNSLLKSISRFSFLMQSIIFKIPLIFFVLLFLGFNHIYIFELLYFNNYYYAIKNEYLNKLTNKIDEKYFELDNIEIESNSEEIEELLFFKIYFKELISMGLIDEKKVGHNYIFSDFNTESNYIFSKINNITNKVGIYNDYGIPMNDYNNNVYNSKTILSEIAKIYFYLLPSITVDQIKQNKFLETSFLIIYEYDEKLDEIEDYYYFSFPKYKSTNNENNNFHPDNIKTNPIIYKSNKKNFTIDSKDKNNEYDDENWFSKQDFLFRNDTNNSNKSIISFEHLNYNYYGEINKTYIVSLQSCFERKNKKYILNLINYFNQINFTTDIYSYSVFLLYNNSEIYKPLTLEKFSDNESFVLNENNIIEISMSTVLYNYFHYGLKDNKNNYFHYGINFDNFDLSKMAYPAEFYGTLKEFYSDTIFMAPIYLFGKLFQTDEYITNKIIKEDLEILEFYNENEIFSICSKFNFDLYIPVIKSLKINCDNLDVINEYYNDNISENRYYYNDNINLPYCGCLPLNCIDQTIYTIEDQYKQKKYSISKRIKLPNKCINYFNFYQEQKQSSNNNLIRNIMNRFLNKERNNYIIFKNIKNYIFPGVSLFVVLTVDNTYLINILSVLIERLTMIEIYILMTIVIWIIVLLLTSIWITIYQSKRLSSIIYQFNIKFEKYIYQLESTEMKENLTNYNDNNNKIYNISENEPLLGNINKVKSFKRLNSNYSFYTDRIIQSSYSLLNDLFYMFCEYYKLDPEEEIKRQQLKTEKSRKEIREDIMSNKNELFELFVKLCLYESKINFSANVDFYSDSPLIKDYNNSLKKGKIRNKNEEKFTREVIYELISTENALDDGLVTNLNFAYISYLNMDEYKSIKNALFNNEVDFTRENFNMKQKFKDDQRKSFIKLLLKNKNVLYNDIQKYYDLDEIKINKLESCFNQFLLKVYYKYLKKIIEVEK